jgi:hypothetical protein
VGSGSAIEQIHLAQTQTGGFQLVYQGRDPLGAGSASALKAEESGSTPQNDSDLLSCSFELKANGASTETSYNLVNNTIALTPGPPIPINFFESSSLVTPQTEVSGGGSSFSRSELQFSQAPAAATKQQGQLSGSDLASIQTSATPPAASQSTGSNGFTQDNIDLTYQKKNINGNGTLTAGFNWSSQQVRWQLEQPGSQKGMNFKKDKEMGAVFALSKTLTGRENKILLSGSFGASTFGQQSATSSAALVFSPYTKDSKKVIKSSYKTLGPEAEAMNGTGVHSKKLSISLSASTTYSFQSLLPWSGENYLKNIKQKASFSGGGNYNYKRVVDAGLASGILEIKFSAEGGSEFINTISPSSQATSAASAFPKWIRDAGDTYAYSGSALGWLELPAGVLQSKKPGKRPEAFDIVLGLAGATGIFLPESLYIPTSGNHNIQLQSTQQYGLSLAGSASLTYFFGGLLGLNATISDSFQYFPIFLQCLLRPTVFLIWISPNT